jgi:hypothetical protein
MDSADTEVAVASQPATKTKTKRLKPARKQVKPGEVVKTETPQTGKEYSMFLQHHHCNDLSDSYEQTSGTTNGLEEIVKTAIPSAPFTPRLL